MADEREARQPDTVKQDLERERICEELRHVRSQIESNVGNRGWAKFHSAALAHPAGDRGQQIWFVPALVKSNSAIPIQTRQRVRSLARKQAAAIAMLVIERSEQG